MDMLKRINTYLRQNGATERLTHRQERRLRKKANRDAKMTRKPASLREQLTAFAEINDTLDDWAIPNPADDLKSWPREAYEDEGRLDDVNGDPGGIIEDEPPFASLCPTCNVTEGQCITKSGKPAKTNHKGRV